METADKSTAVYRKVYRAYTQNSEAFIQWLQAQPAIVPGQVGGIVTLSLYRYHDTFYAYLETTEALLTAETLFADGHGTLISCPGMEGPRFWTELMNIHHWHKPQSLAQWQRKNPVEKRLGMLNKIRPEMVSSYVYYHYLTQETQPGSDNKYVSIFLDENYIFMYVEMPKIVEPTAYPPSLEAPLPPAGPAWHALMEKHFTQVPEVADQPGKFWYEMQRVLSV